MPFLPSLPDWRKLIKHCKVCGIIYEGLICPYCGYISSNNGNKTNKL